MIGLDDVVQTLDLPVHKLFRTLAFGLQLRDCDPVGRRLVGVDDRWLFLILPAIQGLTEKAFYRLGTACRRQVEVDRVSEFVDGSIQIRPLAANLHIGFIHLPAHRSRTTPMLAQPLFNLRCVL